MIALLIVSHSAKVADGVKELADQISQGKVMIYAAGGVDDQTIGTNVQRIYEALQQAISAEGVLVLYDLGSAVMSAEMAVEMLTPEQRQRVCLSKAPLVEGAVVAAIEASLGSPLEAVNTAAEATGTMKKAM